jgi:hypothetical protein
LERALQEYYELLRHGPIEAEFFFDSRELFP